MQTTPKSIETSVQYLKGIGEKRARRLQEIEVSTIFDLLCYFPRRYLDRSHITKIKDLRPDMTVTVVGKIEYCGVKAGRRKRFILALNDDTGLLHCVWFNRAEYWNKIFEKGEMLAVSGKVGSFGDLQMVHPEYDRLSDTGESDFINTGRIIPVYPSSEALSKVGLDSRGFRRVIRSALKAHASKLKEILPQDVIENQSLINLRTAIQDVHFPPDERRLLAARKRLKFDELFFLELMLALRRRHDNRHQVGIEFLKVGDRTRLLIESLPFELTDAQKQVIREIRDDMRAPTAMNRLLQGDVGSGKTLVALVAMMMALENGYQAALMAPTEILADQHFLTVHGMLEALGVNVVLLIGGQNKATRDRALSAIADGTADIVVGTHALIQEGVAFSRLGLAVIDEQHRFGVLQRATLVDKGVTPDTLVMTATPIPRTLAMTLYGDLDVSVIDEMPPGRKPIRTEWRGTNKRQEIYRFTLQRVQAGEQAYIVFPLVEESEKVDLAAAMQSYETLRHTVFKDCAIGLLHGRMKSRDKEKIMLEFKAGTIQVLVSTTVIEVGVDVPNATIIVIENAERFGLPQLHQLRGRVGRGFKESFCFLIAKFPISGDAKTRLNTMAQTNDGFRIAEVDLKLRGPGEFFGTRQHGIPQLRIADLVKDTKLLMQARQEAFRFAEKGNHEQRFDNLPRRGHFFKQYRDKFNLARIA